MSALKIMAHVGKRVSVTLSNGFLLRGNLKVFSRSGILLETGNEFVFLNHFEVKNIHTN